MQRKFIGVLVAILVVAVGVWLGILLLKASRESDTTAAPVVRAELSDRARTGNTTAPGATGSGEARENELNGGSRSGGDPATENPPYDLTEPGELLVANPPSGFATAATQMGFTILEVVDLRQIEMEVYRIAPPRNVETTEAQRRLAARFPGIAVDTHRLYQAQALWEYHDQTARPLAGWPESTEACGVGVRIGQIDSSVDTEHPALRGQRVEFRSFHKKNRRPGPADHGTAIASILVGKPAWGGLLPGAELVAANIFEFNRAGKVIASGLGLLKAVDWMVEKRVQVVNLSIAGGDNRVVRQAFDKARAKGLVLVAAAGNWGSETRPAYPAAYRDVIAVTAFDSRHRIYKKANRGAYIDFAAPGVRIYTAVSRGGRVMSGTSFATPFLTVLLAVQIEAGVPRQPSTLRGILAKRVLDLGEPGKDKIFGWGEVKLHPKCPR